MKTALLALLVISALGCMQPKDNAADPSKPGDHYLSLMVDGIERSYLLHIPPMYSPSKPAALVLVLHGGGGNAENAAKMTGMSDKADAEGFVVAYPEGTGRLKENFLTWDSGNCCGYAMDNEVDDVGFIRALIGELEGNLSIDGRRIYATGISNGGMMSHALGCELSDKVAAIAPVAGALNWANCTPTHPVSVILFHGTADQHVLIGGGKPKPSIINRREREDKPLSYAVSFWAEKDGCGGTPRRIEDEYDVVETYAGCAAGTEVASYTLKGAGHVWPGGKKGWLLADEPESNVSATDVMWEFFAEHPKRQI